MRLITLASAFALASLPALGQDLDFSIDDIPFGADSGDWTNDGECDDPRFWGPGMATVLLSDDLGADARTAGP